MEDRRGGNCEANLSEFPQTSELEKFFWCELSLLLVQNIFERTMEMRHEVRVNLRRMTQGIAESCSDAVILSRG